MNDDVAKKIKQNIKKNVDVNSTNNTDKFFDRYFATHVSGYAPFEARYSFAMAWILEYEKKGITTHSACNKISYRGKESIRTIVDDICSRINVKTFVNYHVSTFAIIRSEDNSFFGLVYHDQDDEYKDEKDIFVDLYALNLEMIQPISKDIYKKYNTEISSRIRWTYISGGQQLKKDLYLTSKDVNEIHDEYYPNLLPFGGYHKFMDDYFASKASILIMIGTPGTGKTSSIRHMLYHRKLTGMVFYDENNMQTDSILVNFLTDDSNDILILEDADKLLGRRTEGNRVMPMLLNASDGLVNILSKKIIITANIADVDDIDEALLRPGRCFGVVRFEELNYKQAEIAAKKAGVEFVGDKDSYTLAEIFTGQDQIKTGKLRKIGFV